MWTREELKAIGRSTKTLVAVSSAMSAAAGAAAGYVIAQRRLKDHYERIAQEEIREAKAHYAKQFDKPPIESISGLDAGEAVEGDSEAQVITEEDIAEAVETLANYKGDPPDPEMVDRITDVIQNPGGQAVDISIFDRQTPIDLPEHLVDARDPERPYLITEEEFLSNETDYTQDSYTYYDGDDVLADRNDQIVLDVDSIVGRDNLMRWGYGSNDVNMIYIRNETRELEIEIAKSDGSYARLVSGFDPDEDGLKHSDHRIKKMRRHME